MLEHPSHHIYHQLIKFAGQYSQWSDLRHLGVMCWMMVGLIAEGKVNLTKWIHKELTELSFKLPLLFGLIRLLSVNQMLLGTIETDRVWGLDTGYDAALA
jgi:hypothetical protein